MLTTLQTSHYFLNSHMLFFINSSNKDPKCLIFITLDCLIRLILLCFKHVARERLLIMLIIYIPIWSFIMLIWCIHGSTHGEDISSMWGCKPCIPCQNAFTWAFIVSTYIENQEGQFALKLSNLWLTMVFNQPIMHLFASSKLELP